MLARGMRAAACATALTTTLLLAGCAGEDDDAPTAGEPTAAATTAAPENEVVQVVEALWAERIRVETSGDYDTADYSQILVPSEIEPMLARYEQFDQGGFRRTGAPQLRDYTATVDGDRAVASVCVNEDEWGAEADAEIAPSDPRGWEARTYRLEQRDGAWLIAGDAQTPDGVSC